MPLEARANFSAADVERFVRKRLVTVERFGSAAAAKRLADRLLDFYLRSSSSSSNAPLPLDNVFYLQRYTQIFSDLQFNAAILTDIVERSARGWPAVFAYKSAYVRPGSVPNYCPVKGERKYVRRRSRARTEESSHGDDQFYASLLPNERKNDDSAATSDDSAATSDDVAMERLYTDWLQAFVFTG